MCALDMNWGLLQKSRWDYDPGVHLSKLQQWNIISSPKHPQRAIETEYDPRIPKGWTRLRLGSTSEGIWVWSCSIDTHIQQKETNLADKAWKWATHHLWNEYIWLKGFRGHVFFLLLFFSLWREKRKNLGQLEILQLKSDPISCSIKQNKWT